MCACHCKTGYKSFDEERVSKLKYNQGTQYLLLYVRMLLKGPQSKIGFYQKWLLHPYITLKNQFLKFQKS